jgi:subtilisin family serine protease
MPLKVLNSSGDGLASDVAQGILYASDNHARIINLSLGDDQEFQVITDAVIYARSQGCLVVAAAGNTGGPVEYPAAQPEALAVAATNNNDLPWSYSNRGPPIDLAAPGVGIFSANSTGFYYDSSGTSMSTAHVSGVAALVWSLHPEWSVDQVTLVLKSTAMDVWAPGRDDLTGWGRVDASAAVYYSSFKYAYFPVVAHDPDP